MTKKTKVKKKKEKAVKITIRVLSVLAVTLTSLIVMVVGVVFILLRGPSERAARLFALSSYETSAMKWVPGLFLTDAEEDAIKNPKIEVDDFVALKTAIINSSEASLEDEMIIQELVNVEPIEIVDIKGSTFKGKLMIVRNPEKVMIGSIDSFGDRGLTLASFLTKYDAIACTNAGGFEDENGTGHGGIPDGIVIRDGSIVYGSAGGTYSGFAGFDGDHILHVGTLTGQQALNLGIVSGTNFTGGPVLVKDGERQSNFVSGINPRTGIGQTEDGTVLLMAIEGRLADSLGATFDDMADIFMEYGAINAVNLDGGSSSGLYYEGERLTKSSSVVGDRPLPTAVIVFR